MKNQPPWSDVAIIVLREGGAARKLDCLKQLRSRTKPSGLELPIDANVSVLPASPRITTLVSTLQAAARDVAASARLAICSTNAKPPSPAASTLASARDLAGKRKFQLVISDLGLPDNSGLDLLGELRESGRVNGIALSGFGSNGDVAAAKAAGFAAHFTKPVDWERLVMPFAACSTAGDLTGGNREEINCVPAVISCSIARGVHRADPACQADY